jgi:LysR family nitrogen assimilation transcriptional regulator
VGEIRLALPHGVIQFLGSNIVEKYRERCPDVKLSIVEGKSSNNYDAVVDGIVDAGMVYAPEEGAEVNVLPLFFERRLVIGPIEPGKDIASIRGFETYPATKLSLLPLILPSRPHHIRLAVEDAARKCGIALNVALDIDGLSALKTMVRNGLGYTVLPYGPVHMEITAGTLAAIPIVNPTLECMVGIVYRKDRQSSRALAGLIAVIRDIVQALGHTRFWRPAESSDSEVVEPNGEWE